MLLNVLDRCPAPLKLLQEAANIIDPFSGRLIISIVLPYEQLMETAALEESLEVTLITKYSFNL